MPPKVKKLTSRSVRTFFSSCFDFLLSFSSSEAHEKGNNGTAETGSASCCRARKQHFFYFVITWSPHKMIQCEIVCGNWVYGAFGLTECVQWHDGIFSEVKLKLSRWHESILSGNSPAPGIDSRTMTHCRPQISCENQTLRAGNLRSVSTQWVTVSLNLVTSSKSVQIIWKKNVLRKSKRDLHKSDSAWSRCLWLVSNKMVNHLIPMNFAHPLIRIQIRP